MASKNSAIDKPKDIPRQGQPQDAHGAEHKMHPEPHYLAEWYQGSCKLKDRVAVVTGGDSGIGRSVAILFAREGANVVIIYHKNDKDAEHTKCMIEKEGTECLLIKGDVGSKKFCEDSIEKAVENFGQLDILVNNAAVQFQQENMEDISEDQLERTFRTNIFSMFFLTQAAAKHLEKSNNATIINTTSVTAFKGHETLLDYASTKGAIVAFTRAASRNLAGRNIRVNAVAPGPIWTPLIPSTFKPDKVKDFGKSTTLGRPGQPEECAPAYVYLASVDSSYVTGEIMHVNGGTPI